MTQSEPNFYQLLGVSPDSSIDAIKKAWKILVKINHPDRHTSEEEIKFLEISKKMSRINEAYATLSNPEKRRIYDLMVGIKDATCSRCGKPGKLRLDSSNIIIAICKDCISWSHSINL